MLRTHTHTHTKRTIKTKPKENYIILYARSYYANYSCKELAQPLPPHLFDPKPKK